MFDLIPFRKRNEDPFGHMLKSFNDMVENSFLSPFGTGSSHSGPTFVRKKTNIR